MFLFLVLMLVLISLVLCLSHKCELGVTDGSLFFRGEGELGNFEKKTKNNPAQQTLKKKSCKCVHYHYFDFFYVQKFLAQ